MKVCQIESKSWIDRTFDKATNPDHSKMGPNWVNQNSKYFSKEKKQKDNTSSFHQKPQYLLELTILSQKFSEKTHKTEVKKTEGWKQAKLDHDWFFLKFLTANCSCPNAARPILKTAQEIASTMGVKTATIRQSIVFKKPDLNRLHTKNKTSKAFLAFECIKWQVRE